MAAFLRPAAPHPGAFTVLALAALWRPALAGQS